MLFPVKPAPAFFFACHPFLFSAATYPVQKLQDVVLISILTVQVATAGRLYRYLHDGAFEHGTTEFESAKNFDMHIDCGADSVESRQLGYRGFTGYSASQPDLKGADFLARRRANISSRNEAFSDSELEVPFGGTQYESGKGNQKKQRCSMRIFINAFTVFVLCAFSFRLRVGSSDGLYDSFDHRVHNVPRAAFPSIVFAIADTFIQGKQRGSKETEIYGSSPSINLKTVSKHKGNRRLGFVRWENLPVAVSWYTVVFTVLEITKFEANSRLALCSLASVFDESSTTWSSFDHKGFDNIDNINYCEYSDFITEEHAVSGSRICITVPPSFATAEGVINALIRIVPLGGTDDSNTGYSEMLIKVHSRESSLTFWRPHVLFGYHAYGSSLGGVLAPHESGLCPVSPNHQPVSNLADASVNSGNKNDDFFRGDLDLHLKSGGALSGLASESYLFFADVPLASTYTLSLSVKESSHQFASSNGIVICAVSEDWPEHQISWASRPAADLSRCVVSGGELQKGVVICFDIPHDFVSEERELKLLMLLVSKDQ